MGKVNKQLPFGETVTYEAKLHWKIFILPALILLLGGYLYLNEWFIFSYLFLGIGFIWLVFFGLIPYFTNKFLVTDKYAIQRSVLFEDYSNDIPLNKIDGITVRKSILGRLFDYGDIAFRSSSTEQVFKGVSSPKEFRQAIEKAQNPQQESIVIQTNSPQSEKKEFWRKLPESIQTYLAILGFITVDVPTEFGLEFALYKLSKRREMEHRSSISDRIQYIQLQVDEMEKEQDSDKMQQRFRMINYLCIKLFDLNGGELNEEEEYQINKLEADAKDKYMQTLNHTQTVI